ncbi:oxidative damage protection protein [Buchnera aphidicola]|uniref:Probable Fe(2+)-trafficking protein n=1 Tax=Buchnera aphidicola str. Ua (Uroleucon ambrosiae) TaxID=1005057 RepID=G2LQ33_BUCUM|nr:oxidative damage protection protein [Buchnera aphidicola]AEO08320.1 protein that protects iron-sulfur proteins against oxidative damage [Buchnera aphidicola str. Ua (Uroleucon ambrosiae)]
MNRIIFCKFLKKKSQGQEFQSYPGKLGEKIYNHISKIAWEKWMKQQTILINEKQLNTSNYEDRKLIENQMKLFLFNETK